MITAIAIATHTKIDWVNLKARYNFTCPKCKKKEPEIKLVKDHILPISLGGHNGIGNIQPLCARCNNKKFTTHEKYEHQSSLSFDIEIDRNIRINLIHSIISKYGAKSPLIHIQSEDKSDFIFLPIARDSFHGLFIETKHGKNDLSEKQEDFKQAVQKQGYKHITFRTFDEFEREITAYLGETVEMPVFYMAR